MRKDGTLTLSEGRAVYKALAIIDEWVGAHANDDLSEGGKHPYGWADIAGAIHELEADVWTMMPEELR